jgi:hypothetical protein
MTRSGKLSQKIQKTSMLSHQQKKCSERVKKVLDLQNNFLCLIAAIMINSRFMSMKILGNAKTRDLWKDHHCQMTFMLDTFSFFFFLLLFCTECCVFVCRALSCVCTSECVWEVSSYCRVVSH